uniref:Uncharacterized protein n=1 Tax=Anguilla anguilla TaxID=7936 RepID=A0A0E9PDJ9_ANGAN
MLFFNSQSQSVLNLNHLKSTKNGR